MSTDVSCRICSFMFDAIEKKGLDDTVLLKGIPYSKEHLLNIHERIEWDVYCRFLQNLRQHFSDKELFEIGASWVKSKYFKPWAILIRKILIFGNSLSLAQKLADRIGVQFFAGIKFQLERIGSQGFKITLIIRDGYEFCPEHLLLVKGSLSVIPTINGYETADVQMTWVDRGATFEVFEPPKARIYSWFYQKIFWLFTSKATVNEIIDAHNLLIFRYRELESARKKLADFSEKLADLRTQERLRIANDLHDDITGNLSSIALLGEALSGKPDMAETDKEQIRDISKIARDTIDSMRDIVWFINPENDDMVKLMVKMRETTNMMLEHTDFSYTTPESDMIMKTEMEFRRNFYLFYKECLQNIVKHSRATKVAVRLTNEESCLHLNIADNGIGFDTTRNYSGHGLKNLARRASEMHGKLTIDSEKSKGTTVNLIVKIP